jgi:hypothetical protein
MSNIARCSIPAAQNGVIVKETSDQYTSNLGILGASLHESRAGIRARKFEARGAMNRSGPGRSPWMPAFAGMTEIRPPESYNHRKSV